MTYLTLREVQLKQLDVLLVFDKICQENHLRYSLAGGTLLGAIRHKGFIPWDDDVDVMMPRPDYEKFIEISKKNIQENLIVLSNYSNQSKFPFTKILDKRIAIERTGIQDVSNLWIDVFPVDGLPSDDKLLRKIYKKNKLYIRIICFSMWKSLKEYSGKQNKIKAFFINIFVKIYGHKRAKKDLEKLAKKYEYGSTNYIGIIAWGMYGVGERIPLSGFETCVDVEFEGHKFKAVSCWHKYLSGIYNDYMQLPPEGNRVSHEIKAYRITQ